MRSIADKLSHFPIIELWPIDSTWSFLEDPSTHLVQAPQMSAGEQIVQMILRKQLPPTSMFFLVIITSAHLWIVILRGLSCNHLGTNGRNCLTAGEKIVRSWPTRHTPNRTSLSSCPEVVRATKLMAHKFITRARRALQLQISPSRSPI